VDSEETRVHLHDAHKRVMSVAAVQQHLHASAAGGPIEMGPYLSRLCEALAISMIGENRPISLKVSGEGGSATSRQAESLGLIATELVINSLKHAFSENTKDGQITVAYEVSGTDWKLSIADNGVGKPDGVFAQPKTRGSARASARRSRNSSVPTLKLWPAQRERPCRSLMPLFWQRCPVSCERR
jgi:chemotaxis protein methyltransferase CheR